MTARPLGLSIHIALAVPTAACFVPAVVIESLGGLIRNFAFGVLTAVAGSVAIVAVVVAVVRWVRRLPPFHGLVTPGSRHESLIALLTGLCLGGYAGAMHEAEVAGLHFSAAFSYFALLPLALLVCCGREPAWRRFLDLTLVMTGVEIGSQTGLMLTRWNRFRWWDDVTGIDLVYWAVGMLAAAIWSFARRGGLSVTEIERIRRTVETGEMLPPRKA